MNNEPLVSIIIVNWNGLRILKDCLESLVKIDYKNWELVLVDNGSVDRSEELAKRIVKKRNVVLIKNAKNLGFAPANNQGVAKSKGKYILLLNNDTKVTKDFLTKMIGRMEGDKNIGVMQPKIHLMEKPELLDNAGSFLTRTGFLQHWGFMQKDGALFDEEKEIFSAKGACLLTRRTIIDKVGLFDDDFFSYFEESDFCWKVWLAGFKVIYFPDAHIYHMLGATSKKMNQVMINYHSFKNRLRSLLEYLEPKNILAIYSIHISIYIGLMIYYFCKLQFDKSSMIYRALLWNLINLSTTMKNRSKIQRLRKISDQLLFDKVMKPINLIQMFKHFRRVEANF